MSMTIKEEIKIIRTVAKKYFPVPLKHYPNRRKNDTRHVLDMFPCLAYIEETRAKFISDVKSQGIEGWNFEDGKWGGDFFIKYEKYSENKDVHS